MQRCRVCNGRGVKVTMRQLGPGMVQQMQSVCPDCHGEGKQFNLNSYCRLHLPEIYIIFHQPHFSLR